MFLFLFIDSTYIYTHRQTHRVGSLYVSEIVTIAVSSLINTSVHCLYLSVCKPLSAGSCGQYIANSQTSLLL